MNLFPSLAKLAFRVLLKQIWDIVYSLYKEKINRCIFVEHRSYNALATVRDTVHTMRKVVNKHLEKNCTMINKDICQEIRDYFIKRIKNRVFFIYNVDCIESGEEKMHNFYTDYFVKPVNMLKYWNEDLYQQSKARLYMHITNRLPGGYPEDNNYNKDQLQEPPVGRDHRQFHHRDCAYHPNKLDKNKKTYNSQGNSLPRIGEDEQVDRVINT